MAARKEMRAGRTIAAPVTINLTRETIDAALLKVARPLDAYLWLQAQPDACDVRTDAPFRRRFIAFYRVRRSRDWQDKFFGLLERRKGRASSFAELLDALYLATGRYDAVVTVLLEPLAQHLEHRHAVIENDQP